MPTVYHLYLCPVCRKPLFLEDYLRRNVVARTVREDELVSFEVEKVVFDKAAGEAVVRESHIFCRECFLKIINKLNSMLSTYGRPLAGSARIVEHERPLVTLLADLAQRDLNLLLSSTLFITLDKLVWEYTTEAPTEPKYVSNLPETCRKIVEQFSQITPSDKVRLIPWPEAEIVVVAHLLAVIPGGLVRLLVPVRV